MRAIFNGPVGRFLIVTLCIGVHLIFAVGMFFLGTFLGSLVLHDIPHGAEIFGVLLAAVMFISAMIVFVYHEYTHEDLDAYEKKTLRYGQFLPALSESQKIVTFLEISSLAYRCVLTWAISPFGAFITFVVGLLMLRFAFLLGKIIHAQTNRPAAVDVSRIREDAGRRASKIGWKQLKGLGLSGLRRVWQGDPYALSEPLDEIEAAKREQQRTAAQLEAQRHAQAEREFAENEKFTQQFLQPAPTGQNGNSGKPHF